MSPAAFERRKTVIPVLGVTGIAWVAIVWKSYSSGATSESCCVPTSAAASFSIDSLRLLFAINPPSAMLLAWALMLVAMMAPLIATPLRHVIDRSFAQRRSRAVFLFLAGSFGIWMGAGVLILSLVLIIRILLPNPLVQIATVGVIAIIWQCSPAKQMCLNRGHAHPELAAFGIAADLSALRFGVIHGIWCVGSCWTLMWLSEMFVAGHIAAMAFVTLWVLAEHIEKAAPPCWRLRGLTKGTRLASAQTLKLLRPLRSW